MLGRAIKNAARISLYDIFFKMSFSNKKKSSNYGKQEQKKKNEREFKIKKKKN